ncbi:hypothetical protein HKW97_17815 [Pseudomonas luteola]|uniref:type II secretion system protein N n=1 Tax=Pseudomonas luteola TaxID=47886 RepID=UPI00388F29C9
MAFSKLTLTLSARPLRLTILCILALIISYMQFRQGYQFYKELSISEKNDVDIKKPEPIIIPPRDINYHPSLSELFGKTNNNDKTQEKIPEVLPESNLNLQVSGIFYRDFAASSIAIIEDNNKTLFLKTGDTIRPGIIVQNIEAHRVMLKRNEKLEQITFKDFSDNNSLYIPPTPPGSLQPNTLLPQSVTPSINSNP